jgi:hypothetical protein
MKRRSEINENIAENKNHAGRKNGGSDKSLLPLAGENSVVGNE